MKKILLLSAAFAACMSMNAQEVGVIDAAALGIGSSATPLAAGKVLAQTDNVTMTVAFDDEFKAVTVNGPKVDDKNFKSIKADGTVLFPDDQGIQGAANAKTADGGNPALTLSPAAQGCVYQFEAKTDGVLYVFHKASSNKNYFVSENGNALGYEFAQLAESPLPEVLTYTVTGDDDWNYVSTTQEPYGILWPEQMIAKFDSDTLSTVAVGSNPVGTPLKSWAKIGKNGVSAVKFNVAEGKTYLFNACGSKATVRGFYFVPGDIFGDPESVKLPTITVSTDDDAVSRTLFAGSGTVDGIESVSAAKAEGKGVAYNLAGQQVNKNYKGVVVKNGKKYIQ